MRTNSIRVILTLAAIAITHSTTTPGQKPHELNGTSWQLVRLQSSDEGTVVVRDGSKYTVTFGTNGRVTARVDCNHGSSTWSSSGANELQFGSSWSMTHAKCAPGSLNDRITEGANVRSYQIKDGHLFLSGRSGGIAYELAPLTTPKRRR